LTATQFILLTSTSSVTVFSMEDGKDNASALSLFSLDQGLPDDDCSVHAIDGIQLIKMGIGEHPIDEIGISTGRFVLKLIRFAFDWLYKDGDTGKRFRSTVKPLLCRLAINTNDTSSERSIWACNIINVIADKDSSLVPSDLLLACIDSLVFCTDQEVKNVHAGFLDKFFFTTSISRVVADPEGWNPETQPPLYSIHDYRADDKNELELDSIVEFLLEYLSNGGQNVFVSAFCSSFWQRSPSLGRVDLMISRLRRFDREVQQQREGSIVNSNRLKDTSTRRSILLKLIFNCFTFMRRDIAHVMTGGLGGTGSYEAHLRVWVRTAQEESKEPLLGRSVVPLIRSFQNENESRESVISFFNRLNFEDPFYNVDISTKVSAHPLFINNVSESLRKMSFVWCLVKNEDEMDIQGFSKACVEVYNREIPADFDINKTDMTDKEKKYRQSYLFKLYLSQLDTTLVAL